VRPIFFAAEQLKSDRGAFEDYDLETWRGARQCSPSAMVAGPAAPVERRDIACAGFRSCPVAGGNSGFGGSELGVAQADWLAVRIP
jgi:hypothetical protein